MCKQCCIARGTCPCFMCTPRQGQLEFIQLNAILALVHLLI